MFAATAQRNVSCEPEGGALTATHAGVAVQILAIDLDSESPVNTRAGSVSAGVSVAGGRPGGVEGGVRGEQKLSPTQKALVDSRREVADFPDKCVACPLQLVWWSLVKNVNQRAARRPSGVVYHRRCEGLS